ncbi:MAG TPA: hypothetical protein VK745_29325 [Polyangiaceae bacterium]|jgi:hypothetical protein|nr:hypothetical protein [Polyangiaceae bacterium]
MHQDNRLRLLAEFERIKDLVYASMVVSGLVLALCIACAVYIARRLPRNRKIIQSYPVPLRLQIVLGVGKQWEGRVDQAHVDDLRALRRNGRYLFAVLVVWLVANSAIGAIRHRLLARLSAIANEAAAKTL